MQKLNCQENQSYFQKYVDNTFNKLPIISATKYTWSTMEIK